jgi:hypothetical protein
MKLCEMMLFIYCNWVSTRWQWSVDWHKNRKETEKMKNNTQNNTKNTKACDTQIRQQKYKTKNIIKHLSSN